MDICGDNRFEIIERAKKHLLDATNIDTSADEMKVLDDFLYRCWQMGWLDRYDTADTPQTEDAYERGVKHAWEVAQKVFNSTVTFYEAEDVAKQMTDCSKCETYWNCQGQCDEIPQIEDDTPQTDWEKEKSEKSLCNSCGKDCDTRKRNLYMVECNRYEPQTDCTWK